MSASIAKSDHKKRCEAVSGNDSALPFTEEKSAAVFLYSKTFEWIDSPRKDYKLQTRLPKLY